MKIADNAVENVCREVEKVSDDGLTKAAVQAVQGAWNKQDISKMQIELKRKLHNSDGAESADEKELINLTYSFPSEDAVTLELWTPFWVVNRTRLELDLKLNVA